MLKLVTYKYSILKDFKPSQSFLTKSPNKKSQF